MTGQLALLLAIGSAAVSLAAAILALCTPGLRFKWLWAIGCLIGFGWMQVAWQGGDVFAGFGINIPSFGASRHGGDQWWIRASIPAIALLFLALRATGKLKLRSPKGTNA